MTSGDHLIVSLELNRTLPFPLLFLLVEDIFTNDCHSKRSKQLLFPGFKRKITIVYQIEHIQRGEHAFMRSD
ncbi:hypothetical protein ACI2OX_17765 [Bacillus sp. N9]